jgi:hypothetical protein
MAPNATSSPSAAFNPVGKTFQQRLDAFVANARASHGLTIRRDSGRTAEWQQRLHICHMFLYNKYLTTKPANTDTGKRTISWAHLSNPKTIWATVPFADIMRTKVGGTPLNNSEVWAKGSEPDQAATEKRAKELLAAAGIGNNGQAMVSAGLKPCGEPCRCGAGRSKHLDDLAADLNTADMGTLTHKLTAAHAGTIDAYLKKFGLHRPLLNHAESPEPWHVEATSP